MAKKAWDSPIDKNVDWGGDQNTDGLPVSGAMIQKFIKESLQSKAGTFHYDTANNRYIVFADTIDRDAYLSDPTRTDLIIGSFDAPFNYSAEINVTTPIYNAMYVGTTGNYVDFTFDIKNKQGATTGENVVITYTFVRNATKQTFSQIGKYGESIHFNVDKYLGEGVNTVIIGIVGQTTLAATTVAVTYQMVNLEFTADVDISKVYNLTKESKTMEIPFTIKGTGTKTVEWYLDGVLLDFVKSEDEIVEVQAERTKYIELANLQQGRHSLQARAYTTINGDRFYTPTIYRDIIVYTSANKNTITAISLEIPAEYGLVTTPILYGVTQYMPYVLKFATYSPSNKEDLRVNIALDGEIFNTTSSRNDIVNECAIISNIPGNRVITITDDMGYVYEIPVIIAPTSMKIEEITQELKLDFSAIGKTSDSPDKDLWSYGDYTGTFNGFAWNSSSGWNNNRLRMSAGSSFLIDYAPLADKPTEKGRTLEFEFMTTNVNDDDAVICDMRNANGVGLLITATKISLMSDAGVLVENEFKANELVRLAIVINKSSGATRKCLSLVYANGSVSRCAKWDASDNYNSDACINFVASSGAELELKAIRIYEAALSDDNILNNYILYRDTPTEMFDIYDRNDVYIEGTTTFSPDKMVSRLPVMIVTGDIPVLENTSDKDTQIIVDIEYTNMQDPSRSFKMVSAAMRPQGTSSMGYPKKNFRIYTQKIADTILYDSNNKVVSDKLYSFKDKAIPVNCWCLKADYAESSGTHNTGIARMWNKALYNMQIDGQYVCRTEAQKAALASGYEYDVRTAIDGFPILLFYRKNATDEPIFIGKYNFNNDKSTEKVFGFTDIPGFNNEKMQCWEVLNNGNAIGLFTDVSDFYNDQTVDGKTKKGWEFAFESRYPDTKTPNTSDLYRFSQWMCGINGDAERFATEKWEHFDIYKMAAYYCYLMRHAAADQLVKNAMLTSEDGEKYYFIQYDNDTINGLINTGDIDILPTDDRQSTDASGEYKFAGHASVLWNMLEGDEEFMRIVKDVDNALYSAGVSYAECVKTFDEEQSDKWVERVYNQDSEYKYIGPFANNGINNLFMLQGKRDLHRRWWLSKRFSIYDAKFVSGEYKSQAIELKCMNDTPAGQKFTITSGYPLDYGYGINDAARESGITLAVGESKEFSTSEVVNLGDPIRIYGAPNIAELDLSKMAKRLAVLNIAKVYNESIGTKLKKFYLGGQGVSNIQLAEISGLKMAKALTHLDIRGMMGITSLDLTSQPYFEELRAAGSGISSVTFAKGAPIKRLELPNTMKSIALEQLPSLSTSDINVVGNMMSVHTLIIKDCPNISNNFDWIKQWYNTKTSGDSSCTLIMNKINWTNVDAGDLLKIAQIGNLNLKGKVTLTEITEVQLNDLINIFGETAFDKNADFYINAPAAMFVAGPTKILEGESAQYSVVVFGGDVNKLTFVLTTNANSYMSIDNEGRLTTQEGAAGSSSGRDVTLQVVANTSEGVKVKSVIIHIDQRTYPTSDMARIEGRRRLENEYETYAFTINSGTTVLTGDWYIEWSLSGLSGYAEIDSQTGNICIVKRLQESMTSIIGKLRATLKRTYNNTSVFYIEIDVENINDTIAETDAGVCQALYNAGFTANVKYATKEEVAGITGDMLNPQASTSSSILYKSRGSINNFEGFKYFTAVTRIPEYTFHNFYVTKKMTLPENLISIASNNFAAGTIEELVWPATLVEVSKSQTFWGDCNTEVIVHPDNPVFMTDDNNMLYSRDGKQLLRFSKKTYGIDFVVPSGVEEIYSYPISSAHNPRSITINHNIKGFPCFYAGSSFKRLEINADIDGTSSSYMPNTSTNQGYMWEFIFNGNLTNLRMNTPQHLKYFELTERAHTVSCLEGITCDELVISEDNPSYKSVNGAIFSKDGSVLYSIGAFGEETFAPAEGLTEIGGYFMQYALGASKNIKRVIIPEGVTTLSYNCFYNSYIEFISLPSTLESKSFAAVYHCNYLKEIHMRSTTPPRNLDNNSHAILAGCGSKCDPEELQILVPYYSVDTYKNSDFGRRAETVGYKIKAAYEPLECLSLSIVANDVPGNSTCTIITYTALTRGVDMFTREPIPEDVVVTGEVVSDEFPQNTSYDEIVEREISFTYLGVTANTKISHLTYIDAYYTVDCNNESWRLSPDVKSPDSLRYDGPYESHSNWHVSNGQSFMYLKIYGYEKFSIYVRSDGESSCDYLMVSKVNETLSSGDSYNSSKVHYTTYGKANSGTHLAAYSLVEFIGLDNAKEYTITLAYRKDGSVDSGTDRAYLLIPKDQF